MTYKDRPLTNAAVTFFPQSGRPVTAPVIDGEYEAALPPGEYQVTVNIGTTLPKGWKEGDPLPRPTLTLPPQYTQRTRSVLSATVTEDSDEAIDFELK